MCRNVQALKRRARRARRGRASRWWFDDPLPTLYRDTRDAMAYAYEARRPCLLVPSEARHMSIRDAFDHTVRELADLPLVISWPAPTPEELRAQLDEGLERIYQICDEYTGPRR